MPWILLSVVSASLEDTKCIFWRGGIYIFKCGGGERFFYKKELLSRDSRYLDRWSLTPRTKWFLESCSCFTQRALDSGDRLGSPHWASLRESRDLKSCHIYKENQIRGYTVCEMKLVFLQTWRMVHNYPGGFQGWSCNCWLPMKPFSYFKLNFAHMLTAIVYLFINLHSGIFLLFSSLLRDRGCMPSNPEEHSFQKKNKNKKVTAARKRKKVFRLQLCCQTLVPWKLFFAPGHIRRMFCFSFFLSFLQLASTAAGQWWWAAEERSLSVFLGCLLSYRLHAELFIWPWNLAGWHSDCWRAIHVTSHFGLWPRDIWLAVHSGVTRSL